MRSPAQQLAARPPWLGETYRRSRVVQQHEQSSAVRFVGRLLSALAILLAVVAETGCTVQFAPNFDKSILDELSSVNQAGAVFFASVERGVPKSSFSVREPAYTTLIGRMDALRILILARPAPAPLAGRFRLLSPLQTANGADANQSLQWPSADSLATLLVTMRQMRDADAAAGLSREIVIGFKRSFDTSMDQALTVERALQR